ncbi:Centrosomal protein cep290 [Sergentomyia squamirostris]
MEVNWKQILSVSPEKIDDDDRKDEIFEEVIRLTEYDKFDGKTFRKLFKLSQHLLRYKGEQVSSLLGELDALATKEAEMEIPEYKSIELENAKLRKQVERLEFTSAQSKGKIKELSEEILSLQKKYQDSQFGSEREDSPDALSDLDRQQELLSNISAKNKHIKRLLRDIETIEREGREHREQVQELRMALDEATAGLASATDKYAEAKFKIREQNDFIEALSARNRDLEDVIKALQKDMEDRDLEIDSFGRKLEERAYAWKNLIDEKNSELETMKIKYEELLEQHPGYNIDAERQELRRLTDDLAMKEAKISDLEAQLESFRKPHEPLDKSARTDSKIGSCCEETQALLDQAKEKISDLEFSMVSLEEDNVLKARQALEAIEALRQYESGSDGLPQALIKIASLERKIKSRDKQIVALVGELNTLQNLSSENAVLRKKLGIADDEFISTTSFHAKQRKLEKLVDRLQLKLRASEEMRLQLKLEKNDLKRKLSSRSGGDDDPIEDVKICEKCLKSFTPEDNICGNCISSESDKEPENEKKIKQLEDNYRLVVDENENLRVGMHEILHKLRDYDATSDHITIDTSTLEKLLHALDARSVSGWYHPAMRMQNELLVVKERELALKERVRISEKQISTQTLPEEILRKATTVERMSQTDFVEESSSIDFDTLLGYIREKGTEIEEFREKCSAIAAELQQKIIDCDSLKQQQEELKHLKETLSLSEDDRDKNLLQKIEESSNLEEALLISRRKLEFLMVDFENLSEELKRERKDRILLVAELQKELLGRKTKIWNLRHEIDQLQNKVSSQIPPNEFKDLQNQLEKSRNFIGKICSEFLDKIPEEKEIKVLKNFEIVDTNFSVDFVTKQEFLDLQEKTQHFQEEVNRLKTEKKHLEEILKVSHQQISSQQDLLTNYSDDEISLRHLVVDLQCAGSEKHLIARGAREIENLRNSEGKLKKQIDNLTAKLNDTEVKLQDAEEKVISVQEEASKNRKNDLLKIQYLSQSLRNLSYSYSNFTPLFLIEDFVQMFSNVMRLRKSLQEDQDSRTAISSEEMLSNCLQKIRESMKNDSIEDKIALVKYQTRSEELEKLLADARKLKEEIQRELMDVKLSTVQSAQHWTTLELLLTENGKEHEGKKTFVDREIQSSPETSTKSTNTDGEFVQNLPAGKESPMQEILVKSSPGTDLTDSNKISETEMKASNKSLESQLKQAMILASTRSTLLLETESRLAEAQGRIKAFERTLEEKEKLLREQRDRNVSNGDQSGRKDDNILSITIASLQNLLLEKDTTLSRYQELLKTERNEHSKSTNEYQKEIEALRTELDQLARRFKEKVATIEELQQKIKDLTEKATKIESPKVSPEAEKLFLDDRYLDEMILDEKRVLAVADGVHKEHVLGLEKKLSDNEDEIRRLQLQLREVSNREAMWERSLTEKDREIAALNERFNTDLRDLSDNITNRREIEQLKEMLEEKDRHINDLTDTLTHFHDDQQKFMSDATLHSADQLAQLSAELSRAEASNKVLNTQIEALKRQITNLGHREKQAREMVKTLKNQLIRRPVISIKNERITSREENLQRRVEQLQSELVDTKEDLRKQTNLAESRKAKSASDLNLWEKQKRWQQVAEKLKVKVSEKESEIEKLKMNLNTAKSQVNRMERERHVLEARLRSGGRGFCHSSTCPHSHVGGKVYTPAESPESAEEYEDEEEIKGVTGLSTVPRGSDFEIIESLKARIESQQRRIVAMELEGKGTSAVTNEVEKLQEKISSLEAQNLRLEARNLQLQLDNDLLKQGDDGERQRRRMKHMEDYVLVLKNELSQARGSSSTGIQQPLSDSHQTILALKRIVERLKVENKTLREGKVSGKEVMGKEVFDKLRTDYEKIQNLHAEALARISSLEIELDLHVRTKIEKPRISPEDDINVIRDKLLQRTELLEKAKLLLTRAAAKEKNLREQIIFWKRKCSELQNVPFIEEISE